MKRVCVFFADGFEEVEGLTVVDLLRRAGMKVEMIAIGDQLSVRGAHDITVQADALFEDVAYEGNDMLVLPGGGPGTERLKEHKGLISLLKKTNEAGGRISAICAAPTILGGLGMLDGKEAVCYPGLEGKLQGANTSARAVEISGNITTSRGLGTAISFSLSLIEQLLGKAKADEIKASIVYQ